MACVTLVACGGAETSPLLDDGGSDATNSDGADGDGSGQPVADAADPCTKLLADLETKRQAAVQCCLTCGTLQCTQQIDGLCCPLTVSSGDSLDSKDYLTALKAVKDAHCSINCPNLACSSKPTDICGPNGNCSQ
jgi:hypothetical protein